MKRAYKEINKEETETTINVLYNEKIISVYSNKIELQKQLKKQTKRKKTKRLLLMNLYKKLRKKLHLHIKRL